MAFLGFATLGMLGKYQEAQALAALDRLNDSPEVDQCAWCLGRGSRKYMVRGERHARAELCDHCEGTGLAVELGVAG